MRRIIAVFAAALVVACGDSTEAPEYDDVSGTYEGPIEGSGSGVTLDATSTAVITQKEGDLSVAWTVKGTVTFFGEASDIEWSVDIAGTIAKGRNPAVSLTMPQDDDCPDLPPEQLTGTHQSEKSILDMRTALPIIDYETCQREGGITLTTTMTKK